MIAWNYEKPASTQHFASNSGSVWLRRVVIWGVACAFLSTFVAAQDKNSSPPPEPLAVVDGQTIDESQLAPEVQAQLQRMMQQVYGVKLRALHAVVDQRLVEAEAKKKGTSPDDLMKSEVLFRVAGPADDQVNAYYQAHQSQMTQPFDEVKEKLRQGMKDLEIQKARMEYILGLWQKAVNDGELVLLVTPPKVELPVDPERVRGDPKAPITIVEFSDFSCPFCRKVAYTMTVLLAKYPGKVRLAYRDFPLNELHPQAQMAAEASRCAGEQGKYWEYHDLLFANPDKQSRDGLLEDARSLKLDDRRFDACLRSGRYKPQIDQDVLLGSRVGVVSTPGFFVNGTFISGAQPAVAFEKIINAELAALNQKQAAN
jgi:protein-disulfide isomerase